MAIINELSVNLGLPESPLTQNPEMFGELKRVYNAIRALARATDVYTGAMDEVDGFESAVGFGRCYFGVNSKLYLQAGEAISYGNLVGIKSDKKVYKSTYGGTPYCIGFCATEGTCLVDDYILVQCVGIYPTLPANSLTPGAKYYQTATSGVLGTTGSQVIGTALSDTTLFINPQL